MREALLTQGLLLAAENGPGAVLLRETGRRVGVSPNAAYRHFANRDDLLAAVADLSMARLNAAIGAALAAVAGELPPDPVERARRGLRALGHAYLRFALTEPGLFRTAFTPAVAASAVGRAPVHGFSVVLDEFVAAGLMRPGQRLHAESVAWPAVHGLACLAVGWPLRGLMPGDPWTQLDRLCEVIEAGLRLPVNGNGRNGV